MINLDDPRSKGVVAWLSRGAGPGVRAIEAAGAAQYRLVEREGVAAEPRFDVAVVDLRGADPQRAIASDLLTDARRLSPAAGLMILASPDIDDRARAAFRRRGEICFVGQDASPVIAAIRERLRLAALVDEMGERIKSLVADNRAASFAALQQDKPTLSVLVAGAPSPLTLNASNAARAGKVETSCVFTAGQAMRALDHARFDGAVFLPTDENDLLFALARALRRHRDYRNIPVMIASRDEALLERFLIRDGFETISAAHIDADLAIRLQQSARRARMAAAVRAFLRSEDSLANGRDGAAGARFFAHHAARTFQRADISGEAVSLAAIGLPATIEADARDAALAQSIRTAGRILRAEDMIARLSSNALIVMLRGVRQQDARAVADRLEGVIGGSLPRALVADGVASAAIQRHPGDDIEQTIAALLRALRGASKAGGLAV